LPSVAISLLQDFDNVFPNIILADYHHWGR
jgi:hypothetical protein